MLVQRGRGKKETKQQQKQRFGRSAKSEGGSGRCRVGKGRQTKKAEREQAEQQTGESKQVKHRSLGIKIDFLRFLTARPPSRLNIRGLEAFFEIQSS